MDLGESRYSFNGVKPSNKSEAVMWNRYNDTLTDFEWDWIKIPLEICMRIIISVPHHLLLSLHPLLARDAVIEAGDVEQI